jgi:hypothetical protein
MRRFEMGYSNIDHTNAVVQIIKEGLPINRIDAKRELGINNLEEIIDTLMNETDLPIEKTKERRVNSVTEQWVNVKIFQVVYQIPPAKFKALQEEDGF